MNTRRYFRTWITPGGNHAIELREEWERKDGRWYSHRLNLWYYKSALSAHLKMQRLFAQDIPWRRGFVDQPIPRPESLPTQSGRSS